MSEKQQKAYDRFTPAQLKAQYNLCITQYKKEQRRIRTLDQVDQGGLWEALGAQFPAYQILPDTNHTAYIKNNLISSVYTVTKCADLMPTSQEDKDIIINVNLALEEEWNRSNIGTAQLRAGTNAALHNLGITQVGWDEDVLLQGKKSKSKGQIFVKNIHPINFMRDPFALDLDNAAYCMTYERYHESVFLGNPNYREQFKRYKADKGTSNVTLPTLTGAKTDSSQDNYYTLCIFWERVVNDDGSTQIDEIHTVDMDRILYVKEDIRPKMFPFALLYCNDPGKNLIGVSEPARAFANSVAANIMDSISCTATYKNQRPPKYVDAASGININSFAKHANDADYTFVVNGDASKAVHYHTYPTVDPKALELRAALEYGIEKVSGVDGRYTGRETGSIITTGGVQEQLNRVTIIDTYKISNYEAYAKRLTQLVLANLVEYGATRSYFIKNPDKANAFSTKTVDFSKLDLDTVYDYQINISAELPKDRARIAEMANQLMEKQMQYKQMGDSVELITPEEWLMFQDLPNKEYMLERMGVQRLNDEVENVSQTLFEFANLTKQGLSPQEAILATAKSLSNKRQGIVPEESPTSPFGAQAMPEDLGLSDL